MGNINSSLEKITVKVDVDLCILSCFHGMDNITWIQSFWNFFLGVSKVKTEKQFCLTPGDGSHENKSSTSLPPSDGHQPLIPRSSSNSNLVRGIWRKLKSWHLQIRLLLCLVATFRIENGKLLPQKGLTQCIWVPWCNLSILSQLAW